MRLGAVRRWMKESIDLDYYDLLFTLQLFMSGNKEAIDSAIGGSVLAQGAGEGSGLELPDYADIMPGIGQVGLQNHLLVNARINVQGLTLEPDMTFASENPFEREFNQMYFAQLAQERRWPDHWYQAGMEIEANGIASCRAGVSDGQPDWVHTPNLDSLWDRSTRSPAHWQWCCDRDRLTPEKCEELYGDALTDEQLERLTTLEQSERYDSYRSTPAKRVIEWQFWMRDYHLVFLGSLFGADSIVLKWGKNGYERLADDPTMPQSDLDELECGPNYFGMIPKSWWVDSWAPGVRRPVSKAETTLKLSAMLNTIEWYLVETLRRTVPITSLDGSKLMGDPELTKEILECKDVRALQNLIVTNGGSVRDMLSRTEPGQLSEVAVYLRNMLKEEINAATGTSDMQRGQALGGERRTRYEVESLMDQSGIQARHFRRQFARFLEDVVQVTRGIAAVHATSDMTLALPTYGRVRLQELPVETLLGASLPVQVNPNSLVYRTEEQRRQEAIAEFQALHVPYIKEGVMDPKKSMAKTMKLFGHKDPIAELGFSEAELARRAAAAMPVPGMDQPVQPVV